MPLISASPPRRPLLFRRVGWPGWKKKIHHQGHQARSATIRVLLAILVPWWFILFLKGNALPRFSAVFSRTGDGRRHHRRDRQRAQPCAADKIRAKSA